MLQLLMNISAHAQQAAPAGKPGFMDTLPMFAILILIMYFLVIRPQSKKMKTHQQFLQSLKRGDEVLTSGGILGTIEGLTDRFVTLEVGDGTKLRVLKTHVSGSSQQPEKKAKADKTAKTEKIAKK